MQPLNIIYQHSFYGGIFPRAWKHAIVLPLFKGRGSCNDASFYRPISFCPCLGKLLEKIVNMQLAIFLTNHNALDQSQHSFTSGRSTVTNMLHFDTATAAILSKNHAHGVISMGFKKAFDKAPHHHVLEALARVGVNNRALQWFGSFISERIQQVRVGDSLSSTCDVISGTVHSSTLGPVLYTILIDPLLRLLIFPKGAFADDIKFVADVTTNTCKTVQVEVAKIAYLSDPHSMSLTIEKSSVMHCEHNQPSYNFTIYGASLQSVDKFVDLGIQRTSCPAYADHCKEISAKASIIAGAIRRAFQYKTRDLMWSAFQTYLLPKLMFCSQAWQKSDKELIEKIQWRDTKNISGMRNLPYSDRLRELNSLTLANRRIYADMIFTYKCINCLINFSATEFGLHVKASITRSNGPQFTQSCPNNNTCATCLAAGQHRNGISYQ